jgi:hypothetical protein
MEAMSQQRRRLIANVRHLFNCQTQLIDALKESYGGDNKNGGPMWNAALKGCRISLLVQSSFMSKSRGSLAIPPGLECTCNGGSGKPADL